MFGLQMGAFTMLLILWMLLELQMDVWTIDGRFYYVASTIDVAKTIDGCQDYRWMVGLYMLLVLWMLLELQMDAWTLDGRFYYVASTIDVAKLGLQIGAWTIDEFSDYRWVLAQQLDAWTIDGRFYYVASTTDVARTIGWCLDYR